MLIFSPIAPSRIYKYLRHDEKDRQLSSEYYSNEQTDTVAVNREVYGLQLGCYLICHILSSRNSRTIFSNEYSVP